MRVVNNSMKPTLQPGDLVLVDPHTYHCSLPQVGDIVVAFHPTQFQPEKIEQPLKIIKRVAANPIENSAPGYYFLASDNPHEGSDSRMFGRIAANHIVGRVTCKWSMNR